MIDPSHPCAGRAPSVSLVAFSEPPSVSTWLENAQTLVAFSEPPSVSTWLENAQTLVAFSEPPSVSTWLENAPGPSALQPDPRITDHARPFGDVIRNPGAHLFRIPIHNIKAKPGKALAHGGVCQNRP